MSTPPVTQTPAKLTGVKTDHDLFVITNIPGKGLGVIAKKDMPIGTIVWTEKPLFTETSTDQEYATAQINCDDTFLRNKLAALSYADQAIFRELSSDLLGVTFGNGKVIPDAIARFRSNAFELAVTPTGRTQGIFAVASRFNHSCRANARWESRDSGSGVRVVSIYVVIPILAGQEVTIDYFGPVQTRASTQARRNWMRPRYGWWCACQLCADDKNGAFFDAVMHVICKYHLVRAPMTEGEQPGVLAVRSAPHMALWRCKASVQAAIQSGLQTAPELLILPLDDAAGVCAAVGDIARAKTFLALILATIAPIKHTENGKRIEAMFKPVLEKPETHEMCRKLGKVEKRWITKAEDAKPLWCDGFWEWLWARAGNTPAALPALLNLEGYSFPPEALRKARAQLSEWDSFTTKKSSK
ncbi:hypothetical protein EDC01DRAFT_631215 [Geopyxis carbonaria]|nr:hypothetical protein EDC01DRAFT_631215 [Geopyxis carbonaria]